MRIAYTEVAKGQKVPMHKGWNLRENAIFNKAELTEGNVGLLPAYCEPVPLCCLDIDDLEKARPILKGIGIDPETIDAARCKSGRPNSLKIFFSLPSGCKPLTTQVIKSNDKVIFELRCATTKGKTVCDVIPTSKHPSGTTYQWDGPRDEYSVTQIHEGLLYYWLGLIEAEKAEKKARENERLSNQQYDDSIDNTLLTELLGHISSDCDYHLWIEIIFAIRSSGLPNSEVIARSWSEASPKFNHASFKAAWDSYRDGHYTVGTLIHHAKQNGWQPKTKIDSAKAASIDAPSSEVSKPEKKTKSDPLEILRSWSSTGNSKNMRQRMLDDKFVIKDMSILGQLTAIYAAPNTGKTLLILRGLVEQIKAGQIDGRNIYYVNADDHGKGQVEKLEIAEQHNIAMLLPNERGFTTKQLFPMMKTLIEKKQAKGIVFVMDTLKKFCDLMDKRSASEFGKLGREFVQAGGTLIVLAHTNKHKKDGEPVYGGTSDIVDDADCVFTLNKISEEEDVHTVEAKNKKARGDVAYELCFQFTRTRGNPYSSLFNSVIRLSSDVAINVKLNAKAAKSLKENSAVINMIIETIREGKGELTKGQIVNEVNGRSTVGKNKIQSIMRLHEGDNYDEHYRWTGIKEGKKWKYVLVKRPTH
jgi:hypothetical protein